MRLRIPRISSNQLFNAEYQIITILPSVASVRALSDPTRKRNDSQAGDPTLSYLTVDRPFNYLRAEQLTVHVTSLFVTL